MKIIFIICASLFNSILNSQIVEYDLTSKSKRITQLKQGTTYILYLPVKKNQKIQISFIMNNIDRIPFNYLYIYEKKKKYNVNSENSVLHPITA